MGDANHHLWFIAPMNPINRDSCQRDGPALSPVRDGISVATG